MRRNQSISGRKNKGVIITLVAVFMLGVVGAMAALSIDVVTLYTARSEAQLAADGAALAGSRVLANSGITSNPSDTTLRANAQALASSVAIRVAHNNEVGGKSLLLGDITVTFPNQGTSDPEVTVHVQRTDLPTFFARIWGTTQLAVAASATAEAYNASGTGAIPVAPICVKPWLLPNIDPSIGGTATIFDPTSGAITNPGLLGWTSTNANSTRLRVACNNGNCTVLPTPVPWKYYPGDPTTFAPPTQGLPACSLIPTLTNYQESIAGCIQTPIACNSQATIDTSKYNPRNSETADAVNCLTHATNNQGDTVTVTPPLPPSNPFEFIAGADDPIAATAGQDVMVSDSLVTVPVFNSGAGAPPNTVQIIGFVQLFLNPDGIATPNTGRVKTTVINMVGCGTSATGTPIIGNGASPVAVRLIKTN